MSKTKANKSKKTATPNTAKRGRPPINGVAYDDRTMVRMFTTDHEGWKVAADTLSKRIGKKISVGTFVRMGANVLAKALKNHKSPIIPSTLAGGSM